MLFLIIVIFYLIINSLANDESLSDSPTTIITTSPFSIIPSYFYNFSILPYWEVQGMKGIMKRQSLIIRKLDNVNKFSTCYEVECRGNSCPEIDDKNRFYSFCYPSLIVTGVPKCGTTAMYEFLTTLPNSVIMHEKENCPYTRRRPHWKFFLSLPSIDKINYNSIIIDGCIDTTKNLIIREILRHPQTIYIVLTRDYKDMLWSAYNFWCNWHYDGTNCNYEKFTILGVHNRTPTIFHEIINGDYNKTKVFIDSPLWNKHPCDNARIYYTEYILGLWKYIPPNGTIVIASEQLQLDNLFVLNKIATKLGISILNNDTLVETIKNISNYRFNTQEGKKDYRHSVNINQYKPGRFAISNFSDMFDSTKNILDFCWHDDCIMMSQLTGYEYLSCQKTKVKLLKNMYWNDYKNRYFNENPIHEIYNKWGINISNINIVSNHKLHDVPIVESTVDNPHTFLSQFKDKILE
jgi:hypothetical protein